jgi:hypothetical protein
VNVFFDVQGTLLTMEEAPRPRAREAFLMLKEKGHDLYLWSSGGAGHAATAADPLGVADLVSGCLDKRQEPDVPVDFAVGRSVRSGGARWLPHHALRWRPVGRRAAESG